MLAFIIIIYCYLLQEFEFLDWEKKIQCGINNGTCRMIYCIMHLFSSEDVSPM